jgi:hypothetical protein
MARIPGRSVLALTPLDYSGLDGYTIFCIQNTVHRSENQELKLGVSRDDFYLDGNEWPPEGHCGRGI